jgi:signal transduction histidine kinase
LGKTIELQPQRCEVGDLIRESVALLGPQCRHAGIDLLVPDDNALLAIWADAEQFGHLLLNILTNAIEAAGPGGKVEILLGETPNGNGFVDIVDSGRGPPPGIAERLFEPFITGKAEGVGLGLAVARHVAEAHGGSIHWFRESGKTRFRIEFPLTHRTALLESGVCS